MFPSEFRFDNLFKKYKLSMGRMISASKSSYCQIFPKHEVIFNANIIIESQGKIWHGDLDLTLENEKLEKIAKSLGEPIYILREMDARFNNENLSFKEFKKKAVKIYS